MKKNTSILVVVLSLCAGLFFLLYWFPQTITQQTLVVQQQINSQQVIGKQHTSHISKNINSYNELDKNSVATTLTEDDLPTAEQSEEELVLQEFRKIHLLNESEIATRVFPQYTPPENASENGAQNPFAVPPGLEDIVQFWVHIFGKYNRNHVVFHHSKNVGIVYSVLDFSDLKQYYPDRFYAVQSTMIAKETERLQNVLKKLQKNVTDFGFDDSTLSHEERRIARLLEKEKDNVDLKDVANKENFKLTYGFAHRFQQAASTATIYMDDMRQIFRSYGLPEELTCIPFVESAFTVNAKSPAQAVGMWQFIPETGRRYLKIDEFVDERLDPILATHAAARHLSHEFKFLKSWPLTVNAYNTGPGRVLRAMRELKTTDIAVIAKTFKGQGYGYDSRNYFPEILAAVHVYNNRQTYFGNIDHQEKEVYDYMVMPVATNIKKLFELADVNEQKLREVNLAIHPDVLNGRKNLPKGYLLKIPAEQKDNILLAAHELYLENVYASEHNATGKQTLQDIAQIYSVSVAELREINNFLPDQQIKSGDIIKLPSRRDLKFTVKNRFNQDVEQSSPDTQADNQIKTE